MRELLTELLSSVGLEVGTAPDGRPIYGQKVQGTRNGAAFNAFYDMQLRNVSNGGTNDSVAVSLDTSGMSERHLSRNRWTRSGSMSGPSRR